MAKKYWWEEDENQTTTQNKTQAQKQTTQQTQSQTEKKYWWDNDTQQSSGKSFWWDDGTLLSSIGNDITNRVNSWLQNHSSYISDYQNRYSGRKYSYEDAYVSDSSDWLAKSTERKSSLDTEAEDILSYIDQYKGYLNQDWIDDVKYAITSARGTHSQILKGATKDNEWWNSFNNEELVSKYGSAEDAYKYYQRVDGYSKKYTGMTSDELYGLVGNMDDGEEKEWLTSYAASVDYDEKSKLDVTAAEAEITALEAEIEDLDDYVSEALDFLVDYIPGTSEYDAQAAKWFGKYGGNVKAMESFVIEKKKQLEEKKKRLESARSIQELISWSSVTGNADFAQNSQYVSNVEYGLLGKPSFTDDTYAYINNPTVEDKRILGVGEVSARALIDTEDAIYGWDTPTRNVDSSYVQDALEYMKEDEVKIYNYYYATEGKEKANEYLNLLINTLKERKYADAFERAYKLGSEHKVLGSISSVATSIGSAFEYLGDIVQYGADILTGKDAKLDKNELAMTTNAIRRGVTDDVNWKIGNWDAFDFLYNTTMSGIDSLTSTAFGPAGGVVLGLSAAAQGTNDALERGMNDGQAFWNGLFSGVFEGLFESLSIGNFNKLKETAINVGLKNIDKTVIKTITKNLGKSMLVNASEEMLTELANITYDTLVNGEFANYTLEELFEKGEWKKALNQVIESGASGALMGMGMSALGSAIGHKKGVNAANEYAVKNYGKTTDTFIQEGLQSDVKSDSYKLASKYQQQVQGKNGKAGKALTGQQIRNLLAANQEQITPKDLKKIQKAAEARLTELGQTEDVEKLAELATKYVTGQKMSKAEKAFLANNKNGNRVAQEALPDNILTRDYTSGWAEGIGTRKVNAAVYNIKSIIERIESMDNPAVYKSLEDRVGEEEKLNVSKSGQATIRSTGETINLSKPEIVDFVRDKNTGKVTDMVLNVDGKEVKASEIDYADGDQSYLFSAVQKIENITPGDAQVIIRDYDPSSGLSVGEYLNGMDEAYTYGYHGYSVEDMKSGDFTTKLSDTQAKSAYVLGHNAKKSGNTKKTEAIKRMRTAVEAETQKAVAEGKEAPKAKAMTITYNHGGGNVVDFDKAGLKGLTTKQKAAPALAKVMHEMGLGTNFELYSSYRSKTMRDKDGNALRVRLNENGVEEAAPSGIYRKSDGTVCIDLNAYNGKQLTLDAMSHELTHFIQQWSDEKYQALAEFLVQTYEKTDMSMHQRVLREQARLNGIRGKDVSYNEAFDEVVANAMGKMLADGKVMERLNELKAQDMDLAQKLWEGLKKLLNKFFRVYENESALFHDAADLMELKAEFEQMKQMWAEAFVEASENFQMSLTAAESQTLTEAGIGFDENTQSVYSLHFSNAYTEQIQVGKKTFDAEAIAQLVSKVTSRSITDARKWVQSEMAIANIVMQNPEFLDFEADNRYEAIKKNSDYPQGTVDLSNLCPKREEFTTMFDMLQKKYPNKLFTAQDVADMRKILSDNDITVACGACFVEDRRQLIGEIADTFIGMWKEAVDTGKPLQKTNAAGNKIELQVTKALAKQYGLTAGTKIVATDTYIPNQYDLTTYEGFKKLEKNHPTIAMAFNRYNNSRGQQSARLIEGRAEYKRQILGWSDAKVKSVNNNGGLRIFSFSDFEVVHLLDLAQVIIDCAAKGVKIQGYTKIPAFAKLVRDTGIKLNRSLIPKGNYGYHMENGKVVLDYDTTEGIDINDKNFIDESNNPNVGNIVIGINPTQIGAAMLDPFIDYIIPFHSNKAKEILRKLGTGEWVNYKESQHEKDIATGTSSKHNVNIYTEVLGKYHPTNKVEFVEAFLKECKRQGKIPRYAEFLNVDANGDYAYREGYHKLLVDFKMFDAEGNILPQGNITPNLNEGFMKDLLNAEIDKKRNYEFPQAVYDAIDKKFGEQYSSQETGLDTNKDTAYHSAKKKTAQEDKTNVRREEVSHRVDAESPRGVGKENSRGEGSARESCERRIKEILREKAFKRGGKSTSGRGRVETKETSADFESRVRNDGFMYVETVRNALAFKVATAQNENASMAASTLKKLGFDVIVFHDNLQHNGKGVTETSDAAITIRSAGGLTIFISSELDIDGMETAYHEAFHAARYGMLAKHHEKIANIIASNVDVESESFDKFVSIIADLYTYTKSDVSASKISSEIIEEFYAWYVGKAYASESGDMKVYMAQFSDVETIKSQIDDVYAQMEANADKALPGLVESQQFSSQETDADYMDALDKGDIVAAQKLVDEAAKAAGYTQKAYHGTGADFNIFSEDKIGGRNVWGKGFYFGTGKGIANDYATWRESKGGKYRIVSASLKMENPYINRKSSLGTAEEILDKWFPDMWKDSRDLGIGYINGKLQSSPLDLLQYIADHNKIEVRDVLKAYGYDSIKDGGELVVFSPTQIKSNDPVVWDDKGKVIPLSKRFDSTNDDIRYSTQETDNISNRDLLANAFEGITKDSKEYELIQEYKGRIKILNEYEEKLAELNAEIRKILFDKDTERDSKKLKELQDEAKKVAENINRNDKKLLSLEASEPLRKVIERERKKEAQKTKDHVKEIQQNKKVRAEQTELRHKIRKAVRDLDKILNRGNKQRNVKEDMQSVVSKALQAADILFTDNYGNYDMLRNGIGANMSDAEEALVESCSKMLKDIDKMPTDGYESWQARQEAENRLNTKMSKLKEVFARERKRLNNTTVSSILGELADAYASLEKSEQSYVQGAYSEPVHNFLKNLQSEVGGTIVKDMTKDQLESVYAAYKMVLNTVRNANKMFNEELKQSREQLGNAVIEEVLKAGGVHLLGTKMGDAVSQFDWNNMKPIWVGNRIGSETFGKLMNGLFKGQYNFAVDIDEVKQFKLSMDEKYHPRNWDAEKLYEFESSTGKKFSLNLQQIMSLYAFSKREQAYSHLLNGGFVFEDNSTVVVDGKLGIKRTYIHKGATSYKLNETTLNGIINSLTAEQKAYVDEMQKYLSDVMGAKGNEVSMQLYGIQMFKEKFYFPLRSSGAYMERAKEAEMKKQQGQINLVNSGFTHSVKPEAKNPIILSGFMDVWAEHCNEMSMYHSMVLPMEDFRKVYNYSTIHDEKMESASVFQTIQDAYGKAATSYIDQLYRELNAGATVDPRETPWKKLISNFKKSAVMLSGSVVVQQFSSIGRAYAVIDPKYFIGTKVNSDTKLSVVEEMKKYAPVAIIKEMGGFDTGTKGGAKSYIMAEQYGKGERLKGLLKDEHYRGDIMGFLPAWADQKTWCAIWEAAKRETKAKNPKMDVKSEEFLKLAGDRFSEVIEKTQVYDSVLARSANMRSKGNFMAMATAFMAEPTTTVNLIEDAIRSGKAKNIARAFGSVAVSIVLNNALASIVYAMRDDDEDETFIEKYFQSFTSGMIDDINPMSYYPFLKDVYSLFQGYDVERADMSVIADVRDALKKVVSLLGKDTSDMDDDELAKHYKQVNEVFMGLLDAGCSVFGVPVKNVRRDAMGIINAFSTIGKDLSGERDNSWLSFWDKVGAAAKDTIPIYAWTKDKAKTDKLYEAIVSGDKAYLARLKSGYKTDDAYHTAVRKALRENDPRIREAALAEINGDPSERVRIAKLIKADGFDQDDVVMAINAEINKLTKTESDSGTTKVKGLYKIEDFVREYANGDMASLDAIQEDILDTAQKNGKTLEDAKKDFASDVRSKAKDVYLDGSLDDATAEKLLVEYADMDEEEAASKVSYWAFCDEHPEHDFTESQVAKYHEFAEPTDIPVDVYAKFISGTKGLTDIKDKWGYVELSKRDQVLEVIDSLPLTWKQKDALYLAAGYSESKIWDVPW